MALISCQLPFWPALRSHRSARPVTQTVVTSGAGDVREELRLPLSHPGDHEGLRRGGPGAVDHPEEQPSINPTRQSAQHRTGEERKRIQVEGDLELNGVLWCWFRTMDSSEMSQILFVVTLVLHPCNMLHIQPYVLEPARGEIRYCGRTCFFSFPCCGTIYPIMQQSTKCFLNEVPFNMLGMCCTVADTNHVAVMISRSVVTLLCSGALICGFLPWRRGPTHSAARPTWRAWCRCTRTCAGKAWSSPWQSWMVTPPARHRRRYTENLSHSYHNLFVAITHCFWAAAATCPLSGALGSFLCLCLRLFLGTGLLSPLSSLPKLHSSRPRVLSSKQP